MKPLTRVLQNWILLYWKACSFGWELPFSRHFWLQHSLLNLRGKRFLWTKFLIVAFHWFKLERKVELKTYWSWPLAIQRDLQQIYQNPSCDQLELLFKNYCELCWNNNAYRNVHNTSRMRIDSASRCTQPDPCECSLLMQKFGVKISSALKTLPVNCISWHVAWRLQLTYWLIRNDDSKASGCWHCIINCRQ